jgi:hypothetical protein
MPMTLEQLNAASANKFVASLEGVCALSWASEHTANPKKAATALSWTAQRILAGMCASTCLFQRQS